MRRPAAAATVSALISVLVGLAFAVAPAATASQWTTSSYTSRLISLLNQARSQHGLPALTVAGGTTEVASAWTAHLASSGSLAHNPDLQHQLETHGSPDWTSYGENVGDGPSTNPDALFQAYMNSPEHKANILGGGYRYLGIAVAFTGDTAWNTMDFVDTYHADNTAAPTAQHSSAPKPEPSHAALRTPTTATGTTHTSTALAAAQPPAADVTSHHRVPKTHHKQHRAVRVRARIAARTAAPHPTTGVAAASPIAALPALPLPRPLAVPAEIAISLAAGLVGFVGVRWVQVTSGARRQRRLAERSRARRRDQLVSVSLVCPRPDPSDVEVSWTATSPPCSPPANAPRSTALPRLRSGTSSRPSSLRSVRVGAQR